MMIVLVYLFSNFSTSRTTSNIPKKHNHFLHTSLFLSPPPKFLQMQVARDCKDLHPPPPPSPPPPKFLQMKHSSKGEASFRVMYYGAAAAGAVPFTWESCPGTPKHHLLCEENSLPPLTPPPSYLSSSTPTRFNTNKSTKSKILGFDFFRKSKSTSEKPLFSSSSSSYSSSKSVPAARNNLYANSRSGNNRWSRAIVHYSFNDDEDEKTPVKATAMPALCFGGNGAVGGQSGMLRRVKNVKKKILLIIGGSGTL